MSVVILCQLGSNVPSDDLIHIPSGVDMKEELKKLKSKSTNMIVVNECGLANLFSGAEPIKGIWLQLERILKDEGVLSIIDNVDLFDHGITASNFRISLQHLNAMFFMYQHNHAEHTFNFKKVLIMEPNMVLPEQINSAIQNKTRLESLFNVNGKHLVCKLVDDSNNIRLGEGKQGEVFIYEKWRSDVAIKRIPNVFPYIKKGDYYFETDYIGKNGERRTDDMLEVFSSAVINSLAIGKSPFGHSINIPRFESFFTCHDTMDDAIDVYIVEELLDETFQAWERMHTDKNFDLTFKTILWQCLYTLVMLNKMGWSHADARHENFMIKKVEPGYYANNVDIGSAAEWTFRLDDKEWKLKNLGYIAKITDFGFMQHLKDPKIKFFRNHWFENYRVPNDEVAPGADIGYFMIFMGYIFALKSRRRSESMKVLFQDWFGLMKSKIPNHMKLFDKIANDGDLKGFTLPSSRLDAKLEKFDVSALLDSAYFNDVITH